MIVLIDIISHSDANVNCKHVLTCFKKSSVTETRYGVRSGRLNKLISLYINNVIRIQLVCSSWHQKHLHVMFVSNQVSELNITTETGDAWYLSVTLCLFNQMLKLFSLSQETAGRL